MNREGRRPSSPLAEGNAKREMPREPEKSHSWKPMLPLRTIPQDLSTTLGRVAQDRQAQGRKVSRLQMKASQVPVINREKVLMGVSLDVSSIAVAAGDSAAAGPDNFLNQLLDWFQHTQYTVEQRHRNR